MMNESLHLMMHCFHKRCIEIHCDQIACYKLVRWSYLSAFSSGWHPCNISQLYLLALQWTIQTPAGNTILFVQSTPQGLVDALNMEISELHVMANEVHAEVADEELNTVDNGYLATWIDADGVGRKQLDTVARETRAI